MIAICVCTLDLSLWCVRGCILHTSTRELSEEKIRPYILIDRLETPQETKRRAFLRAGGDGLQTDDTALNCENTVQGIDILTDSMGTHTYIAH